MARALNGSNQSLQTANGVITATPLTFACWVLINSTAASQRILTSGTAGQATTQSLFFQTSGTLWEYTPDGVNAATSNVAASTGVWVHLVGVTTTAPLSTLYVNGVAQSTTVASTPGFSNTTVTIGANPAQSNLFLNGSVADCAIWNTNLSLGEINALAKSAARPYQIRRQNLVVWWPLDGIQSPEPDFSGSNFNMTLSNAPTLAAGPPMAMLTPRRPIIIPNTAAAATFQPAWAMRNRIIVEGIGI